MTLFRILPLGLVLALAGCGGDDLSRTFGLTRDAPDEFQVTTRAPLSMPPDYSLRPPRPGASRPQEATAQADAEAALVPEAALAAPGTTSPGQEALVEAAGKPAPADIRRRVEADAALDSPGRSFTDRLLFWRKTPQPGVAVDPQREAQRLRENAALGQNPDQGDTPIIQQKRDAGFLGLGLF
jgi:hypothetical protein